MPRYRRRVVEGSVQHLISRFVNREFLLDTPEAREEYLERAARAFARTDWVALGYALMSSHVHWVARAGTASSDALLRGLHCGFSGWLNRTTGRLGPVFADRHRNVECASDTALALLAYVHNNPVRARIVSDPAQSSWTSHRAYVGVDAAPPWLDVELGLKLCGLELSKAGRAAFQAFVLERRDDSRQRQFSAQHLARTRAGQRRLVSLPVELSSPKIVRVGSALEQRIDFIIPKSSPPRVLSQSTAFEVLELVALAAGVSTAELCRRTRARRVSNARRMALLVWSFVLSRPTIDMAQALGLAATTASYHVCRSSELERERAVQLARLLDVQLQTRSAATKTIGEPESVP
jgi:REP element-mobilizing transposase RayT